MPEAARLLRPGGSLVFLVNSFLAMLCTDDEGSDYGDRLVRDHFDEHRFEWADDHSVEFHLSHGAWIDLLHENGFEVERLAELVARPESSMPTVSDYVSREWGLRWPAEEIWKARKR